MKKYFLIIALFICAILVSCKKPIGCCVPPPPSVGVYGQLNGKAWRATEITDSSSYNTIYISAKSDSVAFKFKLVKDAPGTDASYTIISPSKGELTYVLDNAAKNDIQVNYGKGEKAGNIPNVWVTSNFSLTFKLSTPTGDAAFDDKRVVFSDATLRYGLQN